MVPKRLFALLSYSMTIILLLLLLLPRVSNGFVRNYETTTFLGSTFKSNKNYCQKEGNDKIRMRRFFKHTIIIYKDHYSSLLFPLYYQNSNDFDHHNNNHNNGGRGRRRGRRRGGGGSNNNNNNSNNDNNIGNKDDNKGNPEELSGRRRDSDNDENRHKLWIDQTNRFLRISRDSFQNVESLANSVLERPLVAFGIFLGAGLLGAYILGFIIWGGYMESWNPVDNDVVPYWNIDDNDQEVVLFNDNSPTTTRTTTTPAPAPEERDFLENVLGSKDCTIDIPRLCGG